MTDLITIDTDIVIMPTDSQYRDIALLKKQYPTLEMKFDKVTDSGSEGYRSYIKAENVTASCSQVAFVMETLIIAEDNKAFLETGGTLEQLAVDIGINSLLAYGMAAIDPCRTDKRPESVILSNLTRQ